MMKTNLKIEVYKEPYTLALQIQYPYATLRAVTHFLEERNIILESMLMLNDGKSVTILVLHLVLERKFIEEHTEALTKMPGIILLDEGEKSFDENIIRVLSPYLKRK